MKTVLVIIIIILLALLWWFNFGGGKPEEVKEDRVDSTEYYANVQAILRAEKQAEIDAKNAQIKKDSITKENYKREITRLKTRLISGRTAAVKEVSEREPEVGTYLALYDSALSLQDLRIDSLEVEKSVQARMYEDIGIKNDSIIVTQGKEIVYLRTELVKADWQVLELEKKLKRRTFWMWLGLALNAVPRSN